MRELLAAFVIILLAFSSTHPQDVGEWLAKVKLAYMQELVR